MNENEVKLSDELILFDISYKENINFYCRANSRSHWHKEKLTLKNSGTTLCTFSRTFILFIFFVVLILFD